MADYDVNRAGVDKAEQLIDAHQYVLDSEWSDAAPSADDENAHVDRHGWDGFAEWHLGLVADASAETKERYGYPFGDFRRVHRSALIAAKQRAAQNDHTAVEAIADRLLERLDARSAGDDSR